MNIKGNIGKEKFNMTPTDDHSHCHRTLSGEHIWIKDNVGTQQYPFLGFFKYTKVRWITTTCIACGIVKEAKEK